MKYAPHRPQSGMGWLVAAIVLIFIAALGFSILNATHVQHLTCTVEDKDRGTKVTTDGEGNTTSKTEYRIYTAECGVLHVEDSLLDWTWSSSDTYAEMKVGQTYEVTTRGYRIPLFSMFPNVTEAESVR